MSKRRIELVDTSILIDVIGIPMEAIDRPGVLQKLEKKREQGIDLILPVAAIFEAAQHVQRLENGDDRRRCGTELQEIVLQTLDRKRPWTLIELTWNDAFIRDFFEQSPPHPLPLVDTLAQKLGEAGDLLILSELRRLRSKFPASIYEVDVWSHDRGLRTSAEYMHEAKSRSAGRK